MPSDFIQTHILKTQAPYWYAVEADVKTFEVCRADRAFQRGDVLVLRRLMPDSATIEHRPVAEQLEGNPRYYGLRRLVTYVLPGSQFGIESGYVVLGLKAAT